MTKPKRSQDKYKKEDRQNNGKTPWHVLRDLQESFIGDSTNEVI
jgi:hypothetical protein